MPIDDAVYEAESEHRRQMWRHLRSAITLLALVVVVVGAALLSWRNVTDPTTSNGATGPTCAPRAPSEAPTPSDIVLNVYNATARDGVAADVAEKMAERGFTIGDVANDPLSGNVESSAQVRTSPEHQSWASVVMGHVASAEFVPDERSSDTVDLVIGGEFEKLVPAKEATPFSSASLPPCGGTTATPTDSPSS
jgi:hypothetical protein